jgi:hypothetical protein
MSNIRVANIAKAKVLYNKNKETYKIIFAFNVHVKEEDGEIKYIFPTQAKCNYVSGDIVYKELQKDKLRIIETAKQYLRTDYVEFV